MLKVRSFFPRTTKDKYSGTDDFMFDDRLLLNKPKLSHKQTKWNQQHNFDLVRLLKLSQPKNRNLMRANLSTTNSQFIENKQLPSLQKAESKTFQSKQSHEKLSKKFSKENNLKKDNLQLSLCKQSSEKLSNKLYKDQNSQKSQIGNKRKFQQGRMTQSCFSSQSRKLKIQKSKTSFTQKMQSSDLAKIYSNLYNRYEQVPFNELEEAEPILVNLMTALKKQSEDQEKAKYSIKMDRKSFQLKTIEFQKTLRKEIKSLTRDTDHILSLQFRDIRDVNNR